MIVRPSMGLCGGYPRSPGDGGTINGARAPKPGAERK